MVNCDTAWSYSGFVLIVYCCAYLNWHILKCVKTLRLYRFFKKYIFFSRISSALWEAALTKKREIIVFGTKKHLIRLYKGTTIIFEKVAREMCFLPKPTKIILILVSHIIVLVVEKWIGELQFWPTPGNEIISMAAQCQKVLWWW